MKYALVALPLADFFGGVVYLPTGGGGARSGAEGAGRIDVRLAAPTLITVAAMIRWTCAVLPARLRAIDRRGGGPRQLAGSAPWPVAVLDMTTSLRVEGR
jgi:hypothetical protein